MSTPGQLQREIAEQPDVIARLLSQGRATAESLAAEIRRFDPECVVIAARGSSDNAARYAQYLLGARHHLTVALAAPSLITLYAAAPRVRRALVLGISQSGQSPDIVAVVAEAKKQGALTLAITNDPTSPLGQAAAHCLPLHAGEERSVAATKTYTASLGALAMLSAALGDDAAAWGQLEQVPQWQSEALALDEVIAAQALSYRDASRFVTLGRGFNLATAFEVALKIKETSYVIAEPYSSADFLHGPIALVDAGFPLFVVAPTGAAHGELNAVLTQLAQKKARLIVTSDDPAVLKLSSTPLPLPTHVPEWLSPLVSVVPGQLWAQALARALGLDPNRPRGLSKVTKTR